jgi:hypothetical protein
MVIPRNANTYHRTYILQEDWQAAGMPLHCVEHRFVVTR